MDTTSLFIIVIIVLEIISIRLALSALGQEPEGACDDDPSVLHTSYLVYTCIGF
jgi:hypothetical protein